MRHLPAALALLLLSMPAAAGRKKAPECPACPQVECPEATAKPALPERTGLIRRGERQLTLVGPALEVGQPAPTAAVRDAELKLVTPALADGKVRVVMTVPSLDTNTCSVQTRTFNRDASDLGEGVEVLLVSRDLPFAQKRFCVAEGIDRVIPLSDYEAGAFGQAWGVYVKETGLLARMVSVVDGAGVVQYLQVVENQPDEPDYAAALAAVKALAGGGE